MEDLVFHYEDYSTRFEDVTKDLLDFLELEPIGAAPDFIDNKEYGDYYTEEETRAIRHFIREFATMRTWKHLARYFDEDAEETAVGEATLISNY